MNYWVLCFRHICPYCLNDYQFSRANVTKKIKFTVLITTSYLFFPILLKKNVLIVISLICPTCNSLNFFTIGLQPVRFVDFWRRITWCTKINLRSVSLLLGQKPNLQNFRFKYGEGLSSLLKRHSNLFIVINLESVFNFWELEFLWESVFTFSEA